MFDTIKPPTPQNHEILVKVGTANRAHPEQSTLTLSLRVTEFVQVGDFTDLEPEESVSAKPGDDIEVNSGDTVTWIVDDPDITSILVMDDNKNKNVFVKDNPAPLFGSKNWSGLVAKNVSGNKEVETYTICWSQDGITYCYDPKIVVNP